MNNQTKRGSTPRSNGRKPRPGYGKDPFQAAHRVDVNKISKQKTSNGGTALEGKSWSKILKKSESGEGYMSSLKAGVVKMRNTVTLPKGPMVGAKGKPMAKWVPGPGVMPKRGRTRSKMIPAFQGGPGH